MGTRLKEALRETLANWQQDINPDWQSCLGEINLDFDAVDDELMIDPWEPVFPSRRNKVFPGEPEGAHILAAFDNLKPEDVRCVILGQDPYPCPAFSTGRAFEAGNVAHWRELDKMFSKSVRAFIQLIAAARTRNPVWSDSFDTWPDLLSAIETGEVDIGKPASLTDRWVSSGTLLLNSSLTLSRFKVEIDDHQSRGHLLVWRPLMLKVLRYLAKKGTPVVYLGFGDVAAETLALAGIDEKNIPANQKVVLRAHPAFAGEVLGFENPFLLCNQFLEKTGARPVNW